MAEPPGFTFGDLFRKVAKFVEWRGRVHAEAHLLSDDDRVRYYRRVDYFHYELGLIPGIHALIAELPIDEQYIDLNTLAKVRDRLTGGDPWDHSINGLTIAEVVARLRQAKQVALPSPPERRRRKSGTGRPPLTPAEQAARLKLLSDWSAAKSERATMREFCQGRGFDVSELKAAQAWARTKEGREQSRQEE